MLEKYPRSAERTMGPIKFPIALESAYVPPQSFIKSMLEGKPYRPMAALVFVSNPLLTYPDSKATREAFLKLDFIVVSEIFHTATTAIADIVLPAAPIHEHDTIYYWPAWASIVRACPKIVDPPGEAWPDAKIINELAKRVGLGKYFWENWEEALDYLLKPMGITWKEFRDKVRYVRGKMLYDPNKVIPFKTKSGKVEIYSEELEKLGVSPIPTFEELKKAVTGEFELTDEYPFVQTNYKSEVFMLSGYHKVQVMRKRSRPPIVIMNTETAAKLGLKDGDWVYIETRRGRCKQMLLTDPYVHPKVVNVEFGWGENEFSESNINLITSSDPPYDPLTGTPMLRGYPCRVYKA
jgi:anaerobic selenocysteine-containing dehydrogenase